MRKTAQGTIESKGPVRVAVTGEASAAAAREVDFVRSVLQAEADAVAGLAAALDDPSWLGAFNAAVGLIERCAGSGGTVLVTGLGKSGLIGSKISATLASLGIPAHPVHPTEAAHGDLGRFRACDTVIALSFSGETSEVLDLCAILKQDGIPIIGFVGRRASTLERLSTVTLTVNVEQEAAEFAAPTSSTTAMLALGDALALAAARRRNFTDRDFAKRHPGGALGGLLRPVTEVLRFEVGKNLPLIPETETVNGALRLDEQAGRRPGAMVLVDAAGRLSGIFTDGDLRRLILKNPGALEQPISAVMTRRPRVLTTGNLVRDAVAMVRELRLDEIPVVDDAGRPVGVLDVQDLVAMRLVGD
jgi:arabinose-5-phosphate isomerase